MTTLPPRGLFITGTGTGVGKTFVAALLARRLAADGVRVGVYKPVASGCRLAAGEWVSDDALALWEAAGRPAPLDVVCPQRFAAPLAPPLAARAAGQEVDVGRLLDGAAAWRERCDVLLVEGAGGLLSPLADDWFNADLASELGYPLLVVAANRLGVINDTLQTLVAAATFREGLALAGVVLNDAASDAGDDPSRTSNHEQLVRYCAPPVLAWVRHGAAEWPVDSAPLSL